MNLVVRIPVLPDGSVEDDGVAPPTAPASKVKLSNPNEPPTEVPGIDRLLAVVGAIAASPAD
jgi:hypothetical protein